MRGKSYVVVIGNDGCSYSLEQPGNLPGRFWEQLCLQAPPTGHCDVQPSPEEACAMPYGCDLPCCQAAGNHSGLAVTLRTSLSVSFVVALNCMIQCMAPYGAVRYGKPLRL
jgi:hypothetical protein